MRQTELFFVIESAHFLTFGKASLGSTKEISVQRVKIFELIYNPLNAYLVAEVKKLRQVIRRHRDSNQHELCWHHPDLWQLLPEKTDPLPVVPEWAEFLRGCVKYRESLNEQAPDAARIKEPFEE